MGRLENDLACSFCGTSRENAKRMMGSPDGSHLICSACITDFHKGMASQKAGVIPMTAFKPQPLTNGEIA